MRKGSENTGDDEKGATHTSSSTLRVDAHKHAAGRKSLTFG